MLFVTGKLRNESLDALRGFAILAMVLSGSIAYGDVLPAWMYHAQVPPPLHKFDPSIPGITWVDLVFPFFLFSMGAAMPLSLQKYIGQKKGLMSILQIAFKRFFLLVFFALFTEHMKAWVISDTPDAQHHLLSILAFLLLFFQFYENKNEKYKVAFVMVKIASFIASIALLVWLPFHGGTGFSFYKSDIIIIVLANMAFFGTIIYYFTANRPNMRVAVLTFIIAVFLAGKEPSNGWVSEVFYFNRISEFKFDWMYKFYFLKYLLIVIPGTFAGEWIFRSMKPEQKITAADRQQSQNENVLAFIAVCLILCNLFGLFTRFLLFNIISSAILCGLAWYYGSKLQDHNGLFKKLTRAGSYLLLLGLFLEAYEGGIKKDPSTYSYYFVTSGLAFYMLVCFTVLARQKYLTHMIQYLSLNGKNPMVAYVAGSLLVLPLLALSHTRIFWDGMVQNAWMGFLKGVFFTGAVSLVTILFVKKKWFWKT